MIMDALLLFDGAVSAAGVFSGTSVNSGTTFAVGTTDSANVIDVSQLASSASGYGRDIGIGDDPALELVVMVDTQFTGTGATLQASLQTAPDNSGSPGSYSVLAESDAIPVASLVAGFELLRIKIPAGVQKFLKVVYTVATANMTAGAIFAAIVIDRQALGPKLGYRSGYSNQYV